MAKLKIHYQPASDWSKISWLLWACVLLVSPIWASELFYSVNVIWALYTVIVLAIILIRLCCRFLVFSKQSLVIYRVLFWKKSRINLTDSTVKLSVEGRILVINQAEEKEVRLFLSKKGSRLLEEQITA